MEKINYSLNEYADIARSVVAEGCVLLKNEDKALPLQHGDKVAVFGTNAFHYYKSGLGSGGLVNTKYVVSILDALQEEKSITLDTVLLNSYEDWIKENPFDEGYGWGTVPWTQQEMPLSEEVAMESAKKNNVALVCLGRTAGEDQDNKAEKGSYYLTDVELDMLRTVCRSFKRTVVLLNVGNIIDMKWVEEIKPSAVMYVWQGGQEGGRGVADVLVGRVAPSGRLADTIAYDIKDYPSSDCYGDLEKNYYKEDIYVGYRYFETYAKEKVMYPFGYGLSYTEFTIKSSLKQYHRDEMMVVAEVTNVGTCAGKEVVQVYIQAPQGGLGKPDKVLAGFAKTKLLQPGETEQLDIHCPKSYFASYDDSGITGFKSCLVLEEGIYQVYCGQNVRDARFCDEWFQEEIVIEKLTQECAPIEPFQRMHFKKNMEAVPLKEMSLTEKLELQDDFELVYTGDKNIKLKDVYAGEKTLEDFIAQLSDHELICLLRGEGMCSRKGTPGVASVFGGLTKSLRKYGIPIANCADGPSGIRMDCGTTAFSLPNGAAIASTFNTELAENLYAFLGEEMRCNGIDTILGPGINIHRNPLNGRNFEYFSEDPILTGKICAAELKGLKRAGVEGTVKHFCANNQEVNRNQVEAVVSERALREIYLKCFEIAVKEGNAKSIMTTYGPVNGLWTAGNYELCTKILRDEWKFDGIVMTDWWAVANWEGEPAARDNRAVMVRAQNDLFMVCEDTEKEQDNMESALQKGMITRCQLQRNARNVLNFLLNSLSMQILLGKVNRKELQMRNRDMQEMIIPESTVSYKMEENQSVLCIDAANSEIEQENGLFFELSFPETGAYDIRLKVSSRLGDLAQLPVSIYVDGKYCDTVSFRGTEGRTIEIVMKLQSVVKGNHHIKLFFEKRAITMGEIKISHNR